MTTQNAAAFDGFPPSGLKFLRDLKRHNERDWFNERKAVFTGDVERPFHALVLTLAERFGRVKIPLAPHPKQFAFRIYRDVRFSPDKTPYKTHVGAVLYRNGEKHAEGCLYVHVDPHEPFVAAAFYHSAKETLAQLRRAMLEPAFSRCLATLAKRGLTLSAEDTLVRLPPEFAGRVDAKLEPYLKLKSVIVRRAFDPKQLREAKLADEIVAFARDAMPLLTWGWSVV